MTQVQKSAIITVTALAAGICNGLLGAGGGILLVLMLSALYKDSFDDGKDFFINAQAAMLPVTAVSCFMYASRGMLNTESFGVYAIPAVIGGILGGFLLAKMDVKWIKRIFAVIVIWSGVRMLFF